jgi:hypothetical protein
VCAACRPRYLGELVCERHNDGQPAQQAQLCHQVARVLLAVHCPHHAENGRDAARTHCVVVSLDQGGQDSVRGEAHRLRLHRHRRTF